METTYWKLDGMTCSNCSLTVTRYLEKKGKQNVKVNLMNGDVMFDTTDAGDQLLLKKGVEDLGFSVNSVGEKKTAPEKRIFTNHLQRFIFCAIFTLPLMLHMLNRWIPVPFLMNPVVQLILCLPVLIVGMDFFGRSAIRSIRNGLPNMNVLVSIGAIAAFVYSLTGWLMGLGHEYLFFETTATIITLVFFGNYLEDASIRSTRKTLDSLVSSQKVTANMIAFNEAHEEVILPVDNDQLRPGDLILIRAGEQVPADCKILSGTASLNEALITGESLPVEKVIKDKLIGGSVIINGTIKAQVTAASKDSVLAGIVSLVSTAQGEKPPVQLLADRISAIFVPVVLGIALLTFAINLIALRELTPSLMRSIAVLVIACPCAMGLATPAAIAVGLGRAAKNGVIFRNARTLELFRTIRQVVFDKTGTLTTGEFDIQQMRVTDPLMPADEFQKIVYSLEKYSTHPLAKSVVRAWKGKDELRWTKTDETKGVGMTGQLKSGDIIQTGNYQIAKHLTTEDNHNIYVLKNGQLIGWIDLRDEIRPEAKKVIAYFRSQGIKTILLSGDTTGAVVKAGAALGIDEVYGSQTPEQKLQKIAAMNATVPTMMIGDGINDAPALAKATIGISLSEASDIAVQTADVVLMNGGIAQLPLSVGLGKHTYLTIKQNLFWAFAYNIVAIPVAAFGLLSPGLGALVMGLSDIVLGINSVRLRTKRVI
jgi:P-type Cu+ transporter